ARLARSPLPPRCDVRRHRHELRAVQRGRRPRGALPVRRGGHRDPRRGHRGRRLRLALLPAAGAARAALRLPRPRAAQPLPRAALQPEQAAARPLRQGHCRRDRVGPVPVRLHLRRPGQPQRRGLRGIHDQGRGHQPVLRLGGRPAAVGPLQRVVHLRGARQGAHQAPPRPPRGAARDVRRPRSPRDHRPPHQARDHRDRADAGAPVRAGQHAARQGAAQLLGLQHPRLLRPPRRLRRQHPARRHRGPAGPGVQGHGQGHARGRHRGHPRRRLQPHRRGQPPRADAELQGHRQPGVLPPRRRPEAVLHGLHRHRELPQRPPPALAAAHHGLAALLGDRDARRRVPLRPRLGAGPRVLRRRPARDVLRARAAGPGRQPGQAHRRALGRRARRLPGRQLPAAVERVERQVPRHRARLLADGADARGVREPARGLRRPLRALRPPPVRQHQLHHRARRLHPARPRLLQRQAQRGQRRGQQRRREPQPVVEPRGGGADRRRDDPRAARPCPAQLHHHPAAEPGRPDAAARRRGRSHPARQQQHLRPGLRDRLDALGPARPAADRVHRGGLPAARRAPDLPAPAVLLRQHLPRRRRRPPQRHRLAGSGRRADGPAGLGDPGAEDRGDVPQRQRHPRPRRDRQPDHRRRLPALLPRRRRVRQAHAAAAGVLRRLVGAHRHRGGRDQHRPRRRRLQPEPRGPQRGGPAAVPRAGGRAGHVGRGVPRRVRRPAVSHHAARDPL
ncbi:MAG: GH13_11 / GH13 / GH13_13 / GH13_10 / CBM 48 / GH13_37, partial [uncultured Nocardioidaceae bacterium]